MSGSILKSPASPSFDPSGGVAPSGPVTRAPDEPDAESLELFKKFAGERREGGSIGSKLGDGNLAGVDRKGGLGDLLGGDKTQGGVDLKGGSSDLPGGDKTLGGVDLRGGLGDLPGGDKPLPGGGREGGSTSVPVRDGTLSGGGRESGSTPAPGREGRLSGGGREGVSTPGPGREGTLSGGGRESVSTPSPGREGTISGGGREGGSTSAPSREGRLSGGGREDGSTPSPGREGRLSGGGREDVQNPSRVRPPSEFDLDKPGRPGTLPGEAPEESLSSLLSSVMGGLGRPPGASAPIPVDRPAEGMPPAANPRQMVEGLVSRILVSQPTAAGQEARLIVDPSLLPGTEIRLARGLDGFLNVHLISSDPGSLQALAQARGDLERALDRAERTGFKVTVESDREGGSEDGERRSRGLDLMDEPQ